MKIQRLTSEIRNSLNISAYDARAIHVKTSLDNIPNSFGTFSTKNGKIVKYRFNENKFAISIFNKVNDIVQEVEKYTFVDKNANVYERFSNLVKFLIEK